MTRGEGCELFEHGITIFLWRLPEPKLRRPQSVRRRHSAHNMHLVELTHEKQRRGIEDRPQRADDTSGASAH
jgi:hypothetical protein